MLTAELAHKMIDKLKYHEFKGTIVLEVYTSDAHFVSKELYTSPWKAQEFLDEVESHQLITLTIR